MDGRGERPNRERGASRVMRGLDKRRPVRSLDQVYAQAICVAPMLQDKVQEWALASSGMFFRREGGVLLWADAERHPEMKSQIRWPALKRQERAIEKVLRSYGEDVSRLVDVCRQSIVFERMGQLLACLRAMHADDSVVLVRLKNRLSQSYDGEPTAGFRNVSVNLRVVGDAAQSFGVETHVCEVQLILRPFAELMKTDGHRHYVEFRNIRGE